MATSLFELLESSLRGQGCAVADWVVTNVPEAPDLPCKVMTPRALRDSGALAIWPDTGQGLRIVSARAVSGERLWNGAERGRAPPRRLARQ